jgi:hypothetical protein
LSETVTVGCEVAQPVAFLAPAPPDGEALVVTSLTAEIGSSVEGFAVLGSLSGRPIVFVESELPPYRPLGPGLSGPDVLVLERALVASGKMDIADEQFGDDTLEALNAAFAESGLSPVSELRHDAVVTAPGPATVVGLERRRGSQLVEGDLVLLLATDTEPLQCSVFEAVPVSAGQEVSLDAGGSSVAGLVAEVRSDPDLPGRSLVVVDPSRPLEAAMVAEGVSMTLELRATAGEVITVPIGALFSAPGGGYEVRRLADGAAADGTAPRFEGIAVDVGLVVNGVAEITGGPVAVGDEVQVRLPDGDLAEVSG